MTEYKKNNPGQNFSNQGYCKPGNAAKDRLPGNPYADILHLPHHRSSTHPHMPFSDRAAQFAPFSPLTGSSDSRRSDS